MIASIVKYRKLIGFLVVISSLGAAWVHGFYKGKAAGQVKVVTKIIRANEESKKGSDNVRKKEQNLNVVKLDAGLCDLGIVRGNTGCK